MKWLNCWNAVAVAGFLACVIACGGAVRTRGYDEGGNGRGDIDDAWAFAQQFVKKKLRSPSTADFGDFGEQTAMDVVTELGENRYRINAWVDSQNGFGATVRADFQVELELSKEGAKLIDFQIKQR